MRVKNSITFITLIISILLKLFGSDYPLNLWYQRAIRLAMEKLTILQGM